MGQDKEGRYQENPSAWAKKKTELRIIFIDGKFIFVKVFILSAGGSGGLFSSEKRMKTIWRCPDGHGHKRNQRELDEHFRHCMGCRSETTAADHHPVHPATAGIWHEPSYASGGADSQHLPRWVSSWQGRSLRRLISATQVAGVAVQRPEEDKLKATLARPSGGRGGDYTSKKIGSLFFGKNWPIV